MAEEMTPVNLLPDAVASVSFIDEPALIVVRVRSESHHIELLGRKSGNKYDTLSSYSPKVLLGLLLFSTEHGCGPMFSLMTHT